MIIFVISYPGRTEFNESKCRRKRQGSSRYEEEESRARSERERVARSDDTDRIGINEAEESLQAKTFSRDRKITHLEKKLEVEKGILQRIDSTVVSGEMESIREMFMGLRESMDANSSNQQTLDSLEKVKK